MQTLHVNGYDMAYLDVGQSRDTPPLVCVHGSLNDFRIWGCVLGPLTTEDRGGAVSFTLDDVHPHDVGQVLDELGIAVRANHHCAWPLHRALGVQASTRATFYVYNTHAEVEALADGIRYAQRFFGARQ